MGGFMDILDLPVTYIVLTSYLTLGLHMDKSATSVLPIVPSSASLTESNATKTIYPWRSLEIGQSFGLVASEVNIETVKSLAYKTGKRLNRKFKVKKLNDDIIEVGRLPDPVKPFKPMSVGKVEAPAVQPELDVANHWALRKDEVK